ncbi:MAG TPA: hypothetical protein VL137_15610 [Polyangiaceae bacterium]|nr:hypothetical protein [Polyangiaceae bacterium]
MSWSLVAVLLYLLPLGVFLGARHSERRNALSVGFDTVSIVALDFLSVLLLARVVSLELATLISRTAWLVFGGVVAVRRRAEFRKFLPFLRRLEAWAPPLLLALLAVMISRTLSVPCAIWDRLWHIPLVTSMRGQRVPFFNVFERHGQLFYHYLGDAHAAMLQVLSFDHIHASNALSRSHDVMFGLLGLIIGLLAPAFGQRKTLSLAVLTAGALLIGPATLLREGLNRPGTGQSLVNLLSLSFRPHVPLSFFFMFGFTAAALLPLIARKAPQRNEVLLTLFSATGALALTDEISLAFLGLALGVVWLVAPQGLGPRRKDGVLILIGLALTIALVILIYGGTLGIGAPREPMAFVAPQAPGFYQPSVPLSTENGRLLLLLDLLPLPLIVMAGAVSALANRTRVVTATFAAFTLISLLSVVLLTTVVVNGDGLESHRFVTTVLFLGPFYAFYWVAQAGASQWSQRLRQLALGLVLLGVVPSTLSTVEWLVTMAVSLCNQTRGYWGDTYYATDCSAQTGASFGESPTPIYIEHDQWYLISGCHPMFAPVPNAPANKHAVIVNWPETGLSGFAKVDRWAGSSPAIAYCPHTPTADPVCSEAMSEGLCHPSGTDALRCSISAKDRAHILHKR